METHVLMPHIGGGVTHGRIKKWLAEEGEMVNHYQPLAEVSSEKVSVEIPAPETGTLHILQPAGARVAVGAIIATIT